MAHILEEGRSPALSFTSSLHSNILLPHLYSQSFVSSKACDCDFCARAFNKSTKSCKNTYGLATVLSGCVEPQDGGPGLSSRLEGAFWSATISRSVGRIQIPAATSKLHASKGSNWTPVRYKDDVNFPMYPSKPPLSTGCSRKVCRWRSSWQGQKIRPERLVGPNIEIWWVISSFKRGGWRGEKYSCTA